MDMISILFVIILTIKLVICASVYSSNIESTNELLCNQEPERFVQEKGISSSLILDLHPGLTQESCKRLFTTPESHGFFVRLKKIQQQNNGNRKFNEGSKNQRNSTGTCPLRIFSTKDPLLPPWHFDPCLLENNGSLEEPVRVLEGRIEIVWHHGGNKPSYKLSITVLGRGSLCKQNDKHTCLSFGHDPVFCISEDLICDGIRHCPSGIEYDSDEDSDMCEHKKGKTHKFMNNNINLWEKLSMEIFRKIFTTEDSTKIIENDRKKLDNEKKIVEKVHIEVKPAKDKGTLARGLSKYGPWGYLMLGMLLCGTALLICGLWECCCRRQKPFLLTNDVLVNADISPGNQTSSSTVSRVVPPNYDEIEPPPSYSVLFPNLKTSTDITQTQNQQEQVLSS